MIRGEQQVVVASRQPDVFCLIDESVNLMYFFQSVKGSAEACNEVD
jgi:hypothetical protein